MTALVVPVSAEMTKVIAGVKQVALEKEATQAPWLLTGIPIIDTGTDIGGKEMVVLVTTRIQAAAVLEGAVGDVAKASD